MLQTVTSCRPLLPDNPAPTRKTTLQGLAAFFGVWEVEDHNAQASLIGKARAVSEICQSPDGQFLLYQVDGHRSPGRCVGVRHIGCADEMESFILHCTDDLGNEGTYSLIGGGCNWKITGDYEVATFDFSADGGTLQISLTHTLDGSEWRPLCELTLTRLARE